MKTSKVFNIASVLVERLKVHFPELRLIALTKSPEGSKIYVVHLSGAQNEEQELQIRNAASELSSQILIESGYMFLFQFEVPYLA